MFAINHYAGAVKYTCKGGDWVSKNVDNKPTNTPKVLQNSTRSMVRDLVPFLMDVHTSKQTSKGEGARTTDPFKPCLWHALCVQLPPFVPVVVRYAIQGAPGAVETRSTNRPWRRRSCSR